MKVHFQKYLKIIANHHLHKYYLSLFDRLVRFVFANKFTSRIVCYNQIKGRLVPNRKTTCGRIAIYSGVTSNVCTPSIPILRSCVTTVFKAWKADGFAHVRMNGLYKRLRCEGSVWPANMFVRKNNFLASDKCYKQLHTEMGVLSGFCPPLIFVRFAQFVFEKKKLSVSSESSVFK